MEWKIITSENNKTELANLQWQPTKQKKPNQNQKLKQTYKHFHTIFLKAQNFILKM
jgi:hypothetical protein